MKIGVVIPFYGGQDYLDRLLQELEGDVEFELSVFIIDNSIPTEKIAVLPKTNFPVIILNTHDGIGYGRACNIGYNACRERGFNYMVVINQDGYLSSDSLSNMVSVLMMGNDTVAMPLMMEYDSTHIESFYINVYLTKIDNLISDAIRGEFNATYQIMDLCGACFLLDLKRYDEKVLFDELFHMYYEDGDLAKRLLKSGLSVVLVTNAFFHHAHANTNEQIQTINRRGIQRSSHLLFYLKHHHGLLVIGALGSGYLVLRNLISYVITLDIRGFNIELIGLGKTILKIPKLVRSRKNGYIKFDD
jgi:GT2 family glycosyltransferase